MRGQIWSWSARRSIASRRRSSTPRRTAGPGTIFTDAGSTKANIVAGVGRSAAGQACTSSGPPARRVGEDRCRARPGRPVREPRHDPDADSRHDPAAVARVEAFWQALGSRIMRDGRRPNTTGPWPRPATCRTRSPRRVAGITPREWLPLSAGGFRDTTRIAGRRPRPVGGDLPGEPDAVLAALDQFTERLGEFRQLLEAGDGAGLVRWLAEAKQVRDALGS